MSTMLPPLPALRSFVAVAKLGSVGAAAEELHVTHGAISHQVHALEDYLGVPLVNRSGRRTSLTEEGRIYAYQIRQALDDMAAATERMRQQGPVQQLRVAVLPSFAMHWLVPRLPTLLQGGMRISLSASTALVDFENELVDCAIRFGHGQWPDLHCERLMGDTLLLVASPKLFPKGIPDSVTDILTAPILQANENWATWLAAGNIELPRSVPLMEFTDSTHMLEAARRGLGVALTRRSIAAGLLADGELIQLTDIEVAHSSSYYLVWPHRSHKLARMLRFLDWLHTQVTHFETSKAGY
ncbi:LysR substrate-binding domain-containing protein [Chitinimonas sp. PSY-7]|uniref:LysR substrate-binding domain-containing protein n=1 Tax=Chitinimonas sp. PSY-7 TaxID=3459088 RepID=UPI00403FD72B